MLAISPADIEMVDALLAVEDPIEIPASLGDPYSAWERGNRGTSKLVQLQPRLTPASSETRENLARAARSGGEIPSSVEEKMTADREAAEREVDKDDGES
ncbi:MAG: hypothetical protein AAF219_10320 [Myxococcota bacterium]